jgi:hypothetical protein
VPGGGVADHRAGEAEGIDAEMGVEAAVLDGDEGGADIGRQVFQRDCGSAHVAPIGEEGAVGGQDLDVGRALRHREVLDRRQVGGVPGEDEAKADRPAQRQHGRPGEEPPEDGAPARRPPGPVPSAAGGAAGRLLLDDHGVAQGTGARPLPHAARRTVVAARTRALLVARTLAFLAARMLAFVVARTRALLVARTLAPPRRHGRRAVLAADPQVVAVPVAPKAWLAPSSRHVPALSPDRLPRRDVAG